jgi:hypothetical protein
MDVGACVSRYLSLLLPDYMVLAACFEEVNLAPIGCAFPSLIPLHPKALPKSALF